MIGLLQAHFVLLSACPSLEVRKNSSLHFWCRYLYGKSIRTRVLALEDGFVLRQHLPLKKNVTAIGQMVTLELAGGPLTNSVTYPRAENWEQLVYAAEAVTNELGDEHIVLFVKGHGSFEAGELLKGPSRYSCVYGDELRTTVFKGCQEVFLCPQPPWHLRSAFQGQNVTLHREGGELMSSVARLVHYSPLENIRPTSLETCSVSSIQMFTFWISYKLLCQLLFRLKNR
jgi:hypothetical protein